MKHARRVVASLAALALLIFGASLGRSQSTPAAPAGAPGGGRSNANQPPFDKLELFALFAAGPIAAYAKQVIQERGCTFTPDAAFVAAFPYPKVQQILRDIKPRTNKPSTPEREAAFALLVSALEATHHRQFDVSDENYQKALRLVPDSAELHLAYASNFLLVPDGKKAEPEARRSLELWPENAEGHGVLSMALLLQGKFGEAASEARETLRIFPDHMSAKFQLGLSLAQSQEYDEAIPALRSALAVMPSMPLLHKFLGLSLLETKQTAEAIAELKTYVATAPTDAQGHYFLGVALRSAGKQDEANSEFQEGLRLKPDDPKLQAAANPSAVAAPAEKAPGARPDDGSVSQNVYTNNFFGFSYEFPKGWTVLSSSASRAVVEMGSAMLATSDPTQQDVKQVVQRISYPLLFVMASAPKNQPLTVSTIQMSALAIGPSAHLSPDTLLNGIAAKLRGARTDIQVVRPPEKISISGREFWRAETAIPVNGGTSYNAQFVTLDKGYALLLILTAADQDTLGQMEQSVQTIRYLPPAN
jgi:tetratricopeptide (TPR) repeat protein